MVMASSGNKKGDVDPATHKLKAIALDYRLTVYELYERVKGVLFDPNGNKIGEEAFRSRYNRGNEPKWLVDIVTGALLGIPSFGKFLIPTGVGKLKIIGGVGAGARPVTTWTNKSYTYQLNSATTLGEEW